MTDITVKDLADYSGIDIKDLVADLTRRAPDIKWRDTTPVPDALMEAYTKHVDEYKAASEPIGALTSVEGEGASIAQLRMNAEASQYALVEALGEVDMPLIITAAVTHSLAQIEAYEEVCNEVWAGYVGRRVQSGKAQVTAAQQRLDDQSRQRQTGITKRMETQTNLTKAANQASGDAKSFLLRTLETL